MKERINPITKYPHLILGTILLVTLFRGIETVLILSIFNNPVIGEVLGQELLGWVADLGKVYFAFFLITVFESLFKAKKRRFDIVYFSLLLLLSIAHIALLMYFFYEQSPLGKTFFQHTKEEVMFTIQTSGYPVLKLLVSAFIIAFTLVLAYKKVNQKSSFQFGELTKKILLSIGMVFFIFTAAISFENIFAINKSSFFYKESVLHLFFNKEVISTEKDPKAITHFQTFFPAGYVDKDYPFLHKPDTINHLGTYFEPFDTAPNIVFLLVEGLNDDFIHPFPQEPLMPFLNDLKEKSLYWESCFTLGERSFAVVPSILGGLPYGDKSFMQLENYPLFFSLPSVLKENGYQVSFNYGQGSWFHSKDKFFKHEKADYIFDKEDFPKEAEDKKIIVDGYFWGYDDKQLFNYALKNKQNYKKTPYLDVYFTGTMHPPFQFTDEEKYKSKYTEFVEQVTDENIKKQLINYQKYYLTTQFADDAIKEFFEKYKTREEFENTIFIITGDHPMTEVPIQNELKRYHVPLLIYSPKLKAGQTSKNVVSHHDVYQSILNLLREQEIQAPKLSSSLGQALKIEKDSSSKTIVFMDGDRNIREIFKDGFYLAKGKLYEVKSDFSLKEIKNKTKKEELESALTSFKYVNHYTTLRNRLLPMENYANFYRLKDQKNIENKDFTLTKDEFINLLDYSFESTDNYQLLVSVDHKNKNKNLGIIFHITNKNGDDILWESRGFPTSNKRVESIVYELEFPMMEESSELKIYLWNSTKKEVDIREVKAIAGKY